MSAIGLRYSRNRNMIIASHADYRREHFMFSRMQSETMRGMQWENRVKPLRSWSQMLYPALGLAVLAAIALALLV